MNFFNKLPTITYDGNLSRNIMARARFTDATKANSRLFLPYTATGEERVDVLSNQYYGSPGYSWLIWFANETIDPYYDMALDPYDLDVYIIAKYGSITTAQRKIKHYKTNWESDINGITVNAYDSLKPGTQKYWEPILDYNLNVKGYKRKQEDQFLNTNRVCIFTLTSAAEFIPGEEIQLQTNSGVYGFVTYVDGATVGLQHMTGAFPVAGIVVGKESGAQGTIITVNNYAATTAAHDDARYWTSVTFYDYEVDLNEKKKEIVLLDALQKRNAEQELIRVMNR
jgi:hypothetical protein